MYMLSLDGLIVTLVIHILTMYCQPVIIYLLMYKGPFVHKTHWKQTVLYLEDTLKMKKGEEVKGQIAVQKNKDNIRQLNIKVGLKTTKQSMTQYYQLA